MGFEGIKYDPETGKFFNKREKQIGSYTKKYGRISIDTKMITLSRLAVFLMLGYWPEEVDHINGDKHDDRWCNLRPCTRLENAKNKKTYKSSKTGVKGVYRKQYKGKEFYVASIQSDNKRYFLGNFLNLEDAESAYKAASQFYHKEFSR